MLDAVKQVGQAALGFVSAQSGEGSQGGAIGCIPNGVDAQRPAAFGSQLSCLQEFILADEEHAGFSRVFIGWSMAALCGPKAPSAKHLINPAGPCAEIWPRKSP